MTMQTADFGPTISARCGYLESRKPERLALFGRHIDWCGNHAVDLGRARGERSNARHSARLVPWPIALTTILHQGIALEPDMGPC